MAASSENPDTPAVSGRRRATPHELPENSISATRRARRPQGRSGVAMEASPMHAQPSGGASPEATPSPAKRPQTDPWTVPQKVRDRFVQDGNRFYFPDGHEAFRDRGRKLTTPSENTQVINSLVEIARSRDWTEVSVTGTETFRREAWQQARLAGLAVRGYQPSEEERVQLVRAVGRRRDGAPEVGESGAEAQVLPPPGPSAAREKPSRERIHGRLLDHGKDFYRHDPSESPSYFVKLQTAEGPREVWGKDIERAVRQSLSQPKAGDEVILQRTGREAVTVRRQVKDDLETPREAPLDTFRNRWTLETREFLDRRGAAAQVVRDVSVRPQDAVRGHPELTGTYLNLRAAEIAARSLRDQEDQRRFVQQVRLTLARDIERGEPLQPVRLRERSRVRQPEERQREGLTR
jgi:Large polyvalent protein-associated domain 7